MKPRKPDEPIDAADLVLKAFPQEPDVAVLARMASLAKDMLGRAYIDKTSLVEGVKVIV